ncbi:MAG: hypothetical protein QOI29_5650 [Mycobacterium sp.]|nr:hypothetical protein [Mycobacterium sp.]
MHGFAAQPGTLIATSWPWASGMVTVVKSVVNEQQRARRDSNPNLLILSARPRQSARVRYRVAAQRITLTLVRDSPGESGLIRGRLRQESGDCHILAKSRPLRSDARTRSPPPASATWFASDFEQSGGVDVDKNATNPEMDRYRLNDANRRIRNILNLYPQDDWTLKEAKAVLATLSGIARVRQGDSDVALRVAVTLTKPSGQLAEELAAWQISPRSEALDAAESDESEPVDPEDAALGLMACSVEALDDPVAAEGHPKIRQAAQSRRSIRRHVMARRERGREPDRLRCGPLTR